MASLLEKQTLGDHVTTQRCFDAVATIAWISEVRENGVNRDEAEEGVQPGG
jgi:5,10-methylenetetrahydrofolate reductase